MRKIFTLGVMLLFLGMTISSSTGLYVEKQSIKPLSYGNTLYVGGSGPNNYTTIQSAIDDSVDGDTVFVYDDSSPYIESLYIGKSINVIGENKNTTVIDGIGIDDVVKLYANGIEITGFMIQNSGIEGYDAGIGVYSDDNIIHDNIISSNNGGLVIHSSLNNSVNNNNIIDNDKDGIDLRHSSYNNIIENSLVLNGYGGISLYSQSNDNNISQNIIENNNGTGIWLSTHNGNNTIYNNSIFNNNGDGIDLSHFNNNNTLRVNRIISNERCGIDVYKSNFNLILDNYICNNWRGIDIRDVNENMIIDNQVIDNGDAGILLANSNDILIMENMISENHRGMTCIDLEENITIYHNNFIENSMNAYGQNIQNEFIFDNGTEGNYWDDYTGSDANGDGIGDTPYYITNHSGNVMGVDRYPLMEPYGTGDDNFTFFGTLGPICPILNIAEINLIDGNESQIQKIEKMLNSRILQFIIPLWWYINFTELDFTITYNKKIPKIPFLWNLGYVTVLQENENDALIEQPHTVTVKGLNGTFTISRGKLFRFRPPLFLFAGFTYDEVRIELIERGNV